MKLISKIFYRLQQDFFRLRYQKTIEAVLDTAPLSAGTSRFILLSMVQHRDVLPYLVAAKSFATQTQPYRVVVVCDPSISAQDRRLMQAHIPHLEFREATDLRHAQIPVGGTWERLHAICEYARHAYVVQLDADTVTTNPVPEVLEAIAQNVGFVIGERTGQTLESLETVSQRAQGWLTQTQHIQARVEARFSAAALPLGAIYVRGCSGFTGFPKNDSMLESMLTFSSTMRAEFGPSWDAWGTEQITSNYVVANLPGTRLLPFPKYSTPDVADQASALVHFIGSMRFRSDKYRQASLRAIRQFGAGYGMTQDIQTQGVQQ